MKLVDVVYKYRSWDDTNHRNILLQNEMWFAHPFQLNDLFDTRPPIVFDIEGYDTPEAKIKLRRMAERTYPNLRPWEIDVELNYEWKRLQEDPQKFFVNNQSETSKSNKIYDQIGVLSLSEDDLNPKLWGLYGNNSKGFCVGFDRHKLCAMFNLYRNVDYSDEPMIYKILDGFNSTHYVDMLFKKATTWDYEKEFRIVIVGIDVLYKNRKLHYPNDCIEEIILGAEMNNLAIKEIVDIANNNYFKKINVYQVKKSASSYSLVKVKIN
ncbi:MAG: DUF2971 domain-containing protein [Flavipsychrobacter sp.]|nr:DUF2971 domain-containing protein [Flavipsychrobacter sp.]